MSCLPDVLDLAVSGVVVGETTAGRESAQWTGHYVVQHLQTVSKKII